MEERLIEAKFTENKLAKRVLIVSVILIALGFIIALITYLTGEGYKSFGFGYGGVYHYTTIYDSFLDFFFTFMGSPFYYSDTFFEFLIYIGFIGVILSFFFVWEMSKCSLTVTNRRVTGKASFGKSVDLPLNQISAVALGIFSRITVATSSGKIHFWFIENREEVHSALNNVISKVQVESAYNQTNNSMSEADELKKYKELLDNGTITQEEFDAKKKQLLGL